MKRKLVWVKWRDSNLLSGNRYLKAAREAKVAILETVGHLVSEDSDRIVVSQDFEIQDEYMRGIKSIPKENILKKKIIMLEV